MKNETSLTFVISSILVTGLLLSMFTIGGNAFAAVNCSTNSDGIITCSGGTGGNGATTGAGEGINGGSGGHSAFDPATGDLSVSGGGGGGGTGGNPVFHPGSAGGGGAGTHQPCVNCIPSGGGGGGGVP